MNRGTIMETGNRRAVVLTPDGQFVRVKVRRETAVGEEITWSDADAVSDVTQAVSQRRRWMSSAIAAAAVLVLMFGLWSFRTPPVVAYVSMDINPSLEFGLDAHERVRELRAVNADALPIIDSVEYKGKQIEIVMQILARKLAALHMLNAGGGEIVIASVRLRSVDVKWETEVTDKMEQALLQASTGTGVTASNTPALVIEKVYLPVEVREEAKANGISSGKMAFWLAADSKGIEVPLSSIQDESLKKIASSWGGLKKVMHDQAVSKEDKQSWKKLLAQKKEKKQHFIEQSPSPTATDNQSSPIGQPTASVPSVYDSNNDHGGQDQSQSDDSKKDDKQKSKHKDKYKAPSPDKVPAPDKVQAPDKQKDKSQDDQVQSQGDQVQSQDDQVQSQGDDKKRDSNPRKSDDNGASDNGNQDRSGLNSGKKHDEKWAKQQEQQSRDRHADHIDQNHDSQQND